MSKPLDLATMPFATMEAKLVDALPEDDGWQFELKWDGFRCLAVKTQGGVALWSKSARPLHRYFPEVAAAVLAHPGDDFVVDGELLGLTEGTGSFEILQMRLHPAESRIRKLSGEFPATLSLFDMPVAPGSTSLADRPLTERRGALERFLKTGDRLALSPYTRDLAEARTWLTRDDGSNDGIVCKRTDGPYVSGERAMLKVKRKRTADCVVGGFRYGTGSDLVGSLLLGLYDKDGKLNHVGFTSSIARSEKNDLTRKLEALRGEGFTGNAPGGPSRWSTERTEEYVPLKHELVVEVQYDHISGGRFRHGSTLVRWRPDKAPAQCTYEQLGAGFHG
jgi:ATP-dependent DNA ligase